MLQEYKFQVQVPGKEDNKLLTVGRADLDMSQYVLAEGTPQSKMIPMMFKVGMASTGYLKVSITAEAVAGGADSDDGMTEVSAMTGMTANLGEDQDLSGEPDTTTFLAGINSSKGLVNAGDPYNLYGVCSRHHTDIGNHLVNDTAACWYALPGHHSAQGAACAHGGVPCPTVCSAVLQALMRTGQHMPAAEDEAAPTADWPQRALHQPSWTVRQQSAKPAAVLRAAEPSKLPRQQPKQMMTMRSRP
jgi:hypothetical protein